MKLDPYMIWLLIDKLPTLDLSWPPELQDRWFQLVSMIWSMIQALPDDEQHKGVAKNITGAYWT